MRHLVTCLDLFMDGTFKVCPTVFDQLYVIRGPLDDSAISLVYALLPNRRGDTYRELWQIISDYCNDNLDIPLHVTDVMMDFEIAMMDALRRNVGPQVPLMQELVETYTKPGPGCYLSK